MCQKHQNSSNFEIQNITLKIFKIICLFFSEIINFYFGDVVDGFGLHYCYTSHD